LAIVTARLRETRPGGWAVTVLVGILAVAWLVPLWLVVVTANLSTHEHFHDASQWSLPENPL